MTLLYPWLLLFLFVGAYVTVAIVLPGIVVRWLASLFPAWSWAWPRRAPLWTAGLSSHEREMSAQVFVGAKPLPMLDEGEVRQFFDHEDGVVPVEGSATPVPALRLVRR